MAYNITIEEVQNGITVATVNDLGINVTVEEVVNGITITPPVVNQLSVTNVEYPVTVSYNGIIIQDGGGQAVNGIPAGGSIGQFLRKTGTIDYDTAWANISDVNTTYAISAVTATGGANLRLTGSDSSVDEVKLAAGSNITITRTDDNTITFNSSSGFTELVQDTSPQLGGNLDTNGNKISSAGNADVTIQASGTGEINLESIVNVGNGSEPGYIFARGSQSLILTSDPLNNAGSSALRLDVNGDVEFGPGPGGRVLNDSEITVFGTGLAAAQLTTNGSHGLELTTNLGTNSGKITVAAGANGNITVEPNGTGDVYLNADTVRVGDSTATAIITSNSTNPLRLTTNNGTNAPFFQINHTADSITLRDSLITNQIIVNATSLFDTGILITGNGVSIGTNVRDNIQIDGTANGNITVTANGTGDVILRGGNANGGIVTIGGAFNSNISIAPHGTGDVQLNADTVRIGDQNASATLTTWGTGNLTLNTAAGSNSGSIVINQGANGNIAITPNGTGSIVLDGLNWPQADGTANFVLKTNGSGQLAWADANTLGLSVGITDIVEDTTPQLGGDLDVQTNKIITSASNADIKIEPSGTGKVKLGNIAYPNSDGSNGQVLKTNGSGVLGWADKQDPTLVNDRQPNIQSTGQHWYRPLTGAFYTARNNAWEPINDDGFF